MIKECPVILNNSEVTVFEYDDVDVQAPSINRIAKTVKAKKDKNQYTIIDENETLKDESADAE